MWFVSSVKSAKNSVQVLSILGNASVQYAVHEYNVKCVSSMCYN